MVMELIRATSPLKGRFFIGYTFTLQRPGQAAACRPKVNH
jgi:hypothetical protein